MPAPDRFPIEAEISPLYNFAMQINNMPVIRRLTIYNPGHIDLVDSSLRITADPEFFKPFSRLIPRVPSQAIVDAGPIDLVLVPDYLAALTRRTPCSLKVELLDKTGICLELSLFKQDLLGVDHWGGLAVSPELLCYFVASRSPVIAEVLKSAGRPWQGYLSQDPEQAMQQAGAIYAAIQDLKIRKRQPPASPDFSGHQIRSAEAVVDSKDADSLELAVLMASCLEAAGLNAVLVIGPKCILTGFWLEDNCFPEAVQDDFAAVCRYTADQLTGLVLLDSETMGADGDDFDLSAKSALKRLGSPEDLICLIDVKRSRLSGIRSPGMETAGESLHPQQMPRQKQWERKLLDLSLRNPLLNFRPTRSSIGLLAPHLPLLEDMLAGGEDFQVLPRLANWQDEPDNLLQKDLLASEFSHKRLHARLDPGDLGVALTGLYRMARTSLEENGANTLYLALGFLQWYESEVSQQPRRAPLVLIPIEIQRQSASKGYTVRGRDEDPQFNITLLEMLKQDFAIQIEGLDPLPGDENGIDLQGVLDTVRRSVSAQPRWTVQNDACLGIFSFTQFIMWNDIRNRAGDLAQNRVVASLLAGRLTWQPEPLLDPAADLDEICPPDMTFLPVSADASQLAAVYAAGKGDSFVLHGPPGTGKSQTITNIIGNALGHGKTVLFVAEKRAALSVVQRRLEQVGLSPFCLELHSNKSHKKDVLEQLRRTVEINASHTPEDFVREAKRLHSLRSELRVYVRHLFHTHPFGFSLADAIARYGELAGARDGVTIDPKVFNGLDQEKVSEWFGMAGELAAAAAGCGGPYRHPLADFHAVSWSKSFKEASADRLNTLDAALFAAGRQSSRLSDVLGLEKLHSQSRLEEPAVEHLAGQQLRREAGQLIQIVRTALELPDLPAALLRQEDQTILAARLKSLFNQGRQLCAWRQELLQTFKESMLSQPGQALLDAWRQSQLQWLVARSLSESRLRKVLLPHLQPGVHLSDNQLNEMLELLVSCQDARRQTDLQLAPLQPLLGSFWQDLETDWDTGCRFADSLPDLNQTILDFTGLPGTADALRKNLADCLEAPAKREILESYRAACEKANAEEKEISALLGIDFDTLTDHDDQASLSADWFIWLQTRLAVWQTGSDGLREWCFWVAARERAVTAGLQPLAEAIEQGAVTPGNAVETFEKAFYQAAANWIICREPALGEFSGMVFEEKIRQFQVAGERFEQLTRQEIFARLAARLPQFDSAASQNPELGILLRAIKSNGRGLAIRRLFETLPGLLPKLAPCMLMSPISVAQYLDPAQPLFDLVVFDEASQMPTSEAAGAMARGRSVIIVGDPRQLPPTSFFSANSNDDENLVAEDLESVLDDCLALPLPQMHLLWHYRSRHESLIAFSNRQFYENRLLTFPSPNDRVSKVTLVPVDGVYDRGRSKQNVAEAQAVVSEIVRRLEDPVLSAQSIGVVTFSSIQQNLIEDLLTEVFRSRPALEEKALQGLEPVFIKNLENVQGDERDVILFSVGYGPDATGRVSMNFGPINRDGGWRRLNVAVSRARSEMVVFSAIKPEQLDVSRTSSEGVAGLRAFLEFARRGRQAVAARDAVAGQAGLAAQVAAALEENGYQTQLLVGTSGYRIDIGVVHPGREGEYILGILCNGSAYRDARTTRDREVLQRNILNQLGWRLHQVWAIDWWENPAKEVRRILQRIEELKNERLP